MAFKAALALDPQFADAWAGLAQTYAIMNMYSAVESNGQDTIDAAPLALDAAEHALRSDPDSNSARLGRAYVRAHHLDWSGAEADFRAAIAHSSRDATAHQWYGEYLVFLRRWQEATEQMDQALALDPRAPAIHYERGFVADAQADFAAAVLHFDEALRLAPGLYTVVIEKAEDLAEIARYDEAGATARDLPEPQRQVMLSVIAALQDPSRAAEALRQLTAHPLGGTDQPWAFAKLGKYDLALVELERQFRDNDPYQVYLLTIPAYKPMYADPRFQALVRQMKLPDAANDKPGANP